jgi:hypothetical protein
LHRFGSSFSRCRNRFMTMTFGLCGFPSLLADFCAFIMTGILLYWECDIVLFLVFLSSINNHSFTNIWVFLSSKWKWSSCFGTKGSICWMIWLALFSSIFQVESDISLHHFGTGIMQLEIYNVQQRTSVKCWKLRRRLHLLLNQLGVSYVLHNYDLHY